jgi:hypothetical protein
MGRQDRRSAQGTWRRDRHMFRWVAAWWHVLRQHVVRMDADSEERGRVLPIKRTVPGGVAAFTAWREREKAYFQPGIAGIQGVPAGQSL